MRTRLAVLLILAALTVATPAVGETVLGADGMLYRTLVGSYGDLVPGGRETYADAPVLMLEEEGPGGVIRRLLVPGTEGQEVESSPYLLVEPSEDTVYLVWGSVDQVVHSSILLVSLRDETWSPVIEVSGRPFTLKTAARLAVTHDSFPFSIDSPWGRGWMHDRTILHIVWWEESGLGGLVMYAPVTLINGQYTGQHEVLALNDFDASIGDGQTALSTDLLIAPSIGAGDDLHTVVVAFANPDTGRLAVLRLSALPFELTQLADSTHGLLLTSTAGCDTDSGRQQLSAEVASHIKKLGDRLNPVVLDVIASSAAALVLDPAGCAEGLEGLADAARMHIVGIGARASLRLTRQFDGKRRMHIVGIGVKSAVTTGEQHFSINLTASFPLPEIGDGPTNLYVSRDGSALLVAWQESNHLLYRETRDGGWTAPSVLELGAGMTLADAQIILRNRIADRSELVDSP